jgi:Tol biopolymer transport system component
MARNRWFVFLMVFVALALAGRAAAQGRGNGGGGNTQPPDPAIAYLDTRRNDLMVMNEDGSNKTLVLGRLDSLVQPALSIDGQQIAFAGTVGGQAGVYSVYVDGSGLRLVSPIFDGNPGLVDPSWSPIPAPDGRPKIAFWDTADGSPSGNWELWVVNTDGTARQRLTYTPGRNLTSPEWSADATRIVVKSFEGLIVFQLGVVSGQLAIVGEMSVTDVPGSPLHGVPLAFPAWANTLDLLVVSAVTPDSFGNPDLWLIDPAAPEVPVRLTHTPLGERWATFSPDDTVIVFHGDGIQQMNLNGSNIVRLNRRGVSPNRRRG